MKKNISAGGVVINKKGNVIVVNMGYDTWTLLKGGNETGETLLKTAEREIYEETGISKLTFVKKLGVYNRYQMKEGGDEDKNVLKEIHILLFRTSQNDLGPIEPDVIDAKWFTKEEVNKILTHPKDRQFFKSIINEL